MLPDAPRVTFPGRVGKALFGALCALGGQFVLNDEEYAKDKERQRITDDRRARREND
jgi:hypothetical protein